MPHWAYLFEHPTADPRRDRLVLDGEDTRAIVVAVPSAGAAGPVAASLVAEEGVGLIELCGGFSTTDVTAVVDAVGPEVAVGRLQRPQHHSGPDQAGGHGHLTESNRRTGSTRSR